jgi:hypothetical protein
MGAAAHIPAIVLRHMEGEAVKERRGFWLGHTLYIQLNFPYE